MRKREHGAIVPSERYPNDPLGRGIHAIAGFNPVLDEAARLAIVQIAEDRNRVIEQTAGEVPGLYAADGSGGWLYLGGYSLDSYTLAAHGSRHRAMGADPVCVDQFEVPSYVAVLDLVYATGNYTADWADNSVPGACPIIGAVVSKPSTTIAVVAFFGVIEGYTGLVAGTDMFVGNDGGIIAPPLPSTVGIVIQKVGQAISDTALLLDPEQPIAL